MNIPVEWLVLGMVTVAVVTAEIAIPIRTRQPKRWPRNALLGMLSLAIATGSRFAGPLAGALWAQEHGFGLLRLFALPAWLTLTLSIIMMDFAVWLQHLGFHRINWLWRFHMLHHRDPTLDITTGFRFHPIEALLSLIFKGGCAAMLGVPVWAVAAFETWLIAGNLFEHANINLPEKLDRRLRWLLVTPDVHRVHHSRHGDDAQHNYGFAISAWDRLFRTYRATASGEQIGAPGL